MDDEKLSYDEFSKHFLVKLAILSQGDTARQVRSSAIASQIAGSFPPDWAREASRELADDGLARNFASLGQVSILTITGRGLREAERRAAELGFDEIQDEIEQQAETAKPSIVTLDHSADAFKALDAEMARVIAELRSSNSLNAGAPAEASQRVAELEAGRKLLEAEQIDRSLAERMLLDPLRWASLKTAEEVLKNGVAAALKVVAAYFGFKL